VSEHPYRGISALAWSPDGERIAFTPGNGPYFWDVYVVEVESRKATKITSHTWSHIDFCWAPDGKRLALCVSTSTGVREPGDVPVNKLFVVGADGKGEQDIADNAWIVAVSWSPDGEWLAYVNTDFDICLAGLDGKSKRVLVKGGGYQRFDCRWGVPAK
jgi:Tol biopolymer transport system component